MSDWYEQAQCSGHPDPDLWHYESSYYADERQLTEWKLAEARSICNICPVKAECLAEGMKDENMITGNILSGSMWGGLLLGERTKLREKGAYTYTFRQERTLLMNVLDKLAIISK